MRSLFVMVLALLGVAAQSNAQDLVPPKEVQKIPESAELKQAKADLEQVRAQLDKDNKYRRFAEQRFMLANSFFVTWNSGTHPAYILCDAALKTAVAYGIEKKKFDEALAAFNVDKAAYEGTPITDDNRGAMAAWKARLVDRETRGNEWGVKLEAQRLETVKAVGDAEQQAGAAIQDWRDQLVAFQDYAHAAIQIGGIDAKIVTLDKKIKLDKTALENWKRQLPGFYDDVEGMAKQAEETRKENADSAIGLGFSLAVDATVLNNLAKENVLREQIKQVKTTLVNSGVRPEHVKQLLAGWDSTGRVKSMRNARQMIESLSQLMDFAGALDTADKHKYWEALAACLSIFVQHPVLKLIKTNVEVYTNLLHTGLAYATAKARVEQFSKLSDSQLKAVDKLTTLAVKHISERAKLAKEKSSLEIQYGWDSEG